MRRYDDRHLAARVTPCDGPFSYFFAGRHRAEHGVVDPHVFDVIFWFWLTRNRLAVSLAGEYLRLGLRLESVDTGIVRSVGEEHPR